MPQITIRVPAHHVKAYSYTRNVKAPKAKPARAPKAARGKKKRGTHNFAVQSTGKHVKFD